METQTQADSKQSTQNKPRVFYLRGSYLNPFEEQYLLPLQKNYDIIMAHPRSHRYNLSSMTMPREAISCLDYANGLIPRSLAGKTLPNPFKYFGYEEVLLGLDQHTKNCDIVHVPEQSFYFTWQVAQSKHKYNYKMITVQDEVNPFWYLHKPSITKRAAFVREKTDLFIARSQRARTALICEGIPPEKIRVIGHGVDVTRFTPGSRNPQLCEQLGIDRNRFIILFVGRLFWTKGIYALSDAAKLLLREPEIQKLDPLFLIAGDGDERGEFENRVKRLGVENSFKFIGWQPYNLLPEIHRLADIFVLPSISTRYILEQFGIVLIESMASGKPIISTHCGAIDEVIGNTGLLVQPNDYFQLYHALHKLCLNTDLREELGKRGLERVKERFTYKVISSAIASAYEDVLG
ncbi:MAG: glycosyltransferase family 4 protein [Cyanobacteriota bacterium]|nr:glycosyltransferase family 4 protein [Cyanobacteriota bacterium]